MTYSTTEDLPPEVQQHLTPDEQQQWLVVFNQVFAQTHDEEKAQMAAWGAVRKNRRMSARAVTSDDGRLMVRGWGMLFTDPAHPDLLDMHFSSLTTLLADYYQDAPLWYEHGWDLDYAWHPIGRRTSVEIYGYGIWVEHELFPDHPLIERTLREIREGVLSYSSDSIAHYYEQGINHANGEVRVWPLAGWSLTRQPAEPGLGPVTLAGFEATVREVVAAPSRHFPLDDRTIVTVTACKSICIPRPGLLADVDLSTGSPEAREAHGLNGQPISFSTFSLRGDMMDPELLAALAEFLGVEATPETVAAALGDLLAMLQTGGGSEDAAMATVEPAALRSALGMDETAPDEALITHLTRLLDLLNTEPEPEPIYNYEALSRAAQRAAVLADQTPANRSLPRQTRGHGSEDMHTARRSRNLYVPNLNRGARPPGLLDAIQVAAGNTDRAPNLRGMSRAEAWRAIREPGEEAVRTASWSDGPRGAFVLNHEISDEILDVLVADEVIMAAGADQYEMDGMETLTINKQQSLPTSYWVGEHQAATDSEVSWGQAELALKTLVCSVRLPNRWLRNATPRAEQKVRDSIITSMRLKMDRSFLLGKGGKPADGGSTGVEPLGLLNTPGIGTLAVGGAPSLVVCKAAVGQLEDSNVEETETWRWIGHASLFREYTYMTDLNGQPILRESWSGGPERTLVGYEYLKSTQIPTNLGVGGNETYQFFGDWKWFAVGYGTNIELAVSTERYIDELETLVIATIDVDCAVLYPPAFFAGTGVQLP